MNVLFRSKRLTKKERKKERKKQEPCKEEKKKWIRENKDKLVEFNIWGRNSNGEKKLAVLQRGKGLQREQNNMKERSEIEKERKKERKKERRKWK